ncbi:extracellular solute-binding protein [Eubacteriales bacterium OttesenSCG-928-A19]|nr:extracellular solute-binding protein [Eubacteriales bacterium OttesenSCG-928-A19]
MKLKHLVSVFLCLLLALSSAVALASESVYPIEGDVSLTYFGKLHSKVAKDYAGWEDLAVVQDWFDITGVTMKFQTPPVGMEEEQFNLMLASGDYADVIVYNLVELEGGLTKLYEDGVIVDLTDYLEEYAPNYWKYLTDNPDSMREVMSDEGRIYCFVFAKGGGYLLSTQGPILREDIVAELGMELPGTIDEWDAVLRAVKENDEEMIPFTGTMDNLFRSFSPAFGAPATFELTDGTGKWFADEEGEVHYAPAMPEFKDFLTKMNEWYAAGLIDPDIVSLDNSSKDNKMSAGIAFSTFGAGSNQVASFMNANADNEGFSTIGVKYPTLVAGDQVKYITEYNATANDQMAITTTCDNVIEAIQMYDWAYGEEGSLRMNWGVEGESFEYGDDGKPHYTDLILKNPDGKSIDTILANYALVAVKGPAMMVQDPDYMLEYYALDQQKTSMENWSDKDMDSRRFPNVSYKDDEAQVITNAMADINTYVDSMIIKFIVGTESLENFDRYVETISNMGIQNAIDAQQAAVDRYNAR